VEKAGIGRNTHFSSLFIQADLPAGLFVDRFRRLGESSEGIPVKGALIYKSATCLGMKA
jgi:hypothetical protein